MLALMPFVALILIVLALWRAPVSGDAFREHLRDALAAGLLVWGTCIVLMTEGLGAGGVLHFGWIAAGWAVVVLGAGLALAVRIRREARISGRSRMPPAISLSRLDSILLAAIVTALGLMLVVSIASPPQEGDALAYHMGRVAHWAQDQSLEAYATPDARQLWPSPWTEFAVLHLYVLAGSDQWVNLVGWMSLALSAVFATRMAGARSTGQLLSGLFAVTLPIAVPQASSVLTDVPVALWVLVTAWVVGGARPDPRADEDQAPPRGCRSGELRRSGLLAVRRHLNDLCRGGRAGARVAAPDGPRGHPAILAAAAPTAQAVAGQTANIGADGSRPGCVERRLSRL